VNPWAALPAAIRYPLSFGVPFLVALLVTPLLGKMAERAGVMDDPGGHKTHNDPTPYMGGMAVAAGLIVIGAVSAGTEGALLTVIACASGLAILGLLDDVYGLGPLVRFACEVAAGLALWFVGVRAGVMHTAWVDLPITVLWVVALTNAVNFIDNTDGVAASVSAVAALGITLIAIRNGDVLVASLALSIVGGSLGFLRFNFPPARIFLGDAGSLLLGFLLAALTLSLDLPVGPALPRALTTVLLAGVPLFDLAVVVVARLLEGRPVYVGGWDHSTHRLLTRGVSTTRVVLILAGAQAVCSGLAFWLYRASQTTVAIATAVSGIGAIALLVTLERMPTPERGTAGTDGAGVR